MTQARYVRIRETAQDYYRQGSLASRTNDQRAISQYTNAITTLDVIPKTVRIDDDYLWQADAYREISCACIRKKDYSAALDNLDHSRRRLSKCIDKIPVEARTDRHYDILLFCDVVKWAVIMIKRNQQDYFKLLAPPEITENLVNELEQKLQEFRKIKTDTRIEGKSSQMSSANLLFTMNTMTNSHSGSSDKNEKESKVCPKAVI